MNLIYGFIIILLIILPNNILCNDLVDYSKYPILEWTSSFPPPTYNDYLYYYGKNPLKYEKIGEYGDSYPLAPKILIIANSQLYPNIAYRVNRYKDDIVGLGYRVAIFTISGGTAQELKSLIFSNLMAEGGCVLIGDTPMAWYEIHYDPNNDCPYYTFDEYFPCDLYFMDRDGTWVDSDNDGMFDNHIDGSGDVMPEIFLSRICASYITEWGNGNEVDYLRFYFDRLHNFYTGGTYRSNIGLAYIDKDWSIYPEFWTAIDIAFPSNEDIVWPNAFKDDYWHNRLPDNYEFIQISAHGSQWIHQFSQESPSNPSPSNLFSNQIATAPQRAFFANLFSCSNLRCVPSGGEDNCVGKAYLFNNSGTQIKGLATIGSTKVGSMLVFENFYTPISEGKSFGKAFLEWFQSLGPDYSICEKRWHYGMTMMGDPILIPGCHIEIITNSLPDGKIGIYYEAYLEVKKGSGIYTWQIISGSLPDGLILNSQNGQISGTSTMSGDFNFAINAKDSFGCSYSKYFNITILPSPSITSIIPLQGTTAGGTEVQIFGSVGAFEEGAGVYFDLSNSCPQNEGTKIPAESVEYIDSSHLKVKTPRAYEGPVSIFVDNPTIEDICQTSAYNYKTLAFTANQVTQDISIIDTKENKIFEPKGKFNFSGEIIPMSSALSKGNSPARKIYIANKHGGTIEIYDSSNFKYEASVNLMGEGYVNKSAFDIDISSSNKYGYVPLGFRCPAAYDNPSYPGGITIIDLENNSLVDADNDIQTTTFCAPEGISRIDTYPMYPVSLKVVGLEKSICDYGEGEKYPGEYLFVSGTFRPFELPPCEPGRICPPLIFPPTKMGVQVYDISPYIARYPKNPPVTEPPDACRLPNLEPNPDYLKRVAFFGDGSNPSEDIYSIQGLDFAIHQNGVPTGATVYILNPYENYAYIVEYDAVTVTFSLKTNPDGTLFKIPTGQSPTDVKVQKVSTQTGYQTFAYITNALDDSVTVIDTATNQELPWPQSPIFEDYCYDSENYPTSFDTRSTGDFGYSTNFHSNTVSPFYLPTNSCYSPPNSDGAIHVGEAPIRIVVQPVPSGELFFKNVKDALSFATPSDFTTPSKQAVLIRDWEKVQELQETNANPKAVLSNIENFQKNVNKWIVNENLKKNINENMNLYRAGYILDHPEVK